MYELKTKLQSAPVAAFLDQIADGALRSDCYTIVEMMEKVTGKPAAMWGTAIIGCDSYHYKYPSGHEGDMCLVGFSPRKANITVYVTGCDQSDDELLQQMGKFKVSKACLYIKKLADINPSILEAVMARSAKLIREEYPA